MSTGYQKRDEAVVDYRLWQAPGGDWLRGPPPPSLEPGSYFACVGAAQTFGCFVERPWPALLGNAVGLPALNLGIAGAGPALFRIPRYRRLIAGARFVVLQVMSGRSADCSRFQSGGSERLEVRGTGRRVGAVQAWTEVLQRDLDGLHDPVLRGLHNRLRAWFGRRDVRRLVRETQADWSAQFAALLDEIRAPKVLLWFASRAPHYRPRYHSVEALFGAFPQLVQAPMVRALAARVDRYVECVTSRGSPQPLFDRRTGRPTTVDPEDATGDAATPWTHNAYYPSPQMHEDAALALAPVCRELLAGVRGAAG